MGRFSKLETQSHARPGPEPADAPPGEEEYAHDAPSQTRRGERAWFAGDETAALRWYSRAMQTDAALLEPWVAHARILILTDQIREAGVWINRALSVFPGAPPLLALRAVQHACGGMIRQAMASSDAVLTSSGDDPSAWLSRGHVLIVADNKNAEFCFQQAIQSTRADDWQTPFWIGLTLDSERRWSSSIPYYEKALARRAELPYAWLRIARAHAHLGRRDAARRALERADETCGDDDRLRSQIRRAPTGSIFGRLRALFLRK